MSEFARARDGAQAALFENTAYRDACGDLLHALRRGCYMGDEHVFTLLDAEPTLEDRKRLAVGLAAAGLIGEDHAEAAFGLWPLAGA